MFSTGDGQLKEEFRRGTTSTAISALCFSPESHYLGVASASETGHIFKLADRLQDNSKFSMIVPGSRDFAHVKAKGKYKILAIVPKVYADTVSIIIIGAKTRCWYFEMMEC